MLQAQARPISTQVQLQATPGQQGQCHLFAAHPQQLALCLQVLWGIAFAVLLTVPGCCPVLGTAGSCSCLAAQGQLHRDLESWHKTGWTPVCFALQAEDTGCSHMPSLTVRTTLSHQQWWPQSCGKPCTGGRLLSGPFSSPDPLPLPSWPSPPPAHHAER